jgi:hypothetical protein
MPLINNPVAQAFRPETFYKWCAPTMELPHREAAR